jgi:hypothetical protein
MHALHERPQKWAERPQKRTSSKIPSEYAPGLDFKSPKSRKAISDALYDLWDYCVEEQIPLLNMLVVLKGSGLPSTGIENWYEKKFGSLTKYDEYCDLHAKLAEFVLQNGLVILQP